VITDWVTKVRQEMESAERLEHPMRLLRITLECGHFRLMPWQDCLGGIGWSTQCNICTEAKGSQVGRQIVNVEETGAL
jgi:hypothetical protein